MKVLISGGGTAGHVNPAIAIADFIRRKHSNADIRFVGTSYGIENKLVVMAGYHLYQIEVYGFRRKLDVRNARAALKALSGVVKAKTIIREFKPDVVIGTGGYVSGSVVWAACDLKIPTAIHEQNAFPGFTTKQLSWRVDKVMLGFDSAKEFFKRETVVVGNPINEKFLSIQKNNVREKIELNGNPIRNDYPLILSFGGSMGSRPFNEDIIELIKLHAKSRSINHIHAAGQFGIKWVPTDLEREGIRLSEYPSIDIREYIYNMEHAMAAADLVIARAGAIILSEIAAMGKPSILIPSPNAANNHQYYNAKAFANSGASLIVEEDNCSGEVLWGLVSSILGNQNEGEKMGLAAEKLAITDSTSRIYCTIMDLLSKQ